MAKFCLTVDAKRKFIQALKSREIDPAKLSDMSSTDRRAFLEGYVGKGNGVQVNGLFESKLLLKNKIQGYKTWVNKVSGISKEAKRDLISRIERMDKILNPAEERAFLEDLASTRLGFGVSESEAKVISDLSKQVSDAKEKGEKFGAHRVALEKYVSELKTQSKPSEFVRPTSAEAIGQDVKATVKLIAQNTRAFVASFDNSLWGNQGVRAALDPRYTTTWAKNFAKSFQDIAKTLVKGKNAGDEILDATKAEIFDRPNSINGRYEMSTPETSRLDLGGIEEEFPTSLPSRIPVLGRFFKAAEVAYEAGAIRLRADIADKMYAIAEKQGVNMLDKFEVGSRNVVVNSITGRGRIKVPDIVNDAVFSVKYTKSQLDFLTAMQASKISSSAKKEAAKNTLGVLATTAVILGISKSLDPDSTDFDPRSTRFGKIEKDGFTLINLMPGYGSMVNLISRIIRQSTKNRQGIVKPFGSGYGQTDGMDAIWDYTENKASPIASIIRDLVRQSTFEGDKPTLFNTAQNAFTSISLESSKEILEDKSGDSLLKAIAIGLGILGTGAGTTYYPDKWENKTTKEMKEFKSKLGEVKLKEASKKFNDQYKIWLQKRVKSTEYKKLSDDDKQKDLTKKKNEIKQSIFLEYGFD